VSDTTVSECDLIIVGAGPAGLYGAYYAGFRGLTVTVVDALPHPGGQLAALYPEKKIFDVAGFPAIKAQHLVDALVEQAEQARPTYLMGHVATELEEFEDSVRIAKAVLVAAGIGKFTPRPLPAGSEFHDRGLRYFVPRLNDLAGEHVMIVGGGDSAVDWALSLEPIAKSVVLVHRRNDFRAHAHSLGLLERSSVDVLTPFEVEEIAGEDAVESVTIVDGAGVERRQLAVSSVVAALGFKAALGPIATWGLDKYQRDIAVDRTMRTNRRRVFAVGDVAGHEDKVKLIAVGFAEAATAVNHIAPLVDGSAPIVPGHSSDSIH
jgi:thioredoxin reductase